jgi:hypothetical protein
VNLDRKVTKKGCVEYVDPDMRGMGVPIQIPPGFAMYRVCGNMGCLNAQHCYFVDGDTAHQIEIALRERMLEYLRDYFKVDHDTLRPIEEATKEANGDKPRLWTPR